MLTGTVLANNTYFWTYQNTWSFFIIANKKNYYNFIELQGGFFMAVTYVAVSSL